MDELPSNNIIEFPKEKIINPSNIQSYGDFLKQTVEYKISFANDISEILSQHIFSELARSGIDFETRIDDLFPSMILLSEAIQSLQLRANDIHHPLQDFANETFRENDEAENDVDNTENKDYNIIIEKDEE